MKKNIQLRCSKALYYYKLALFFPFSSSCFNKMDAGFTAQSHRKPRVAACAKPRTSRRDTAAAGKDVPSTSGKKDVRTRIF